MLLLFIGETLDFLGKVTIALTVLIVHDTLRHERKLDEQVTSTLRKEHVFGMIGIVLMTVGYVLKEMGRFSEGI